MWEQIITLSITKGEVHITAVLTHGQVLGTASNFQSNATTIVATVDITLNLTLVFTSNRVFVTPICTILDAIANLVTVQTQGSVFTLIKPCLFTADGGIRIVSLTFAHIRFAVEE